MCTMSSRDDIYLLLVVKLIKRPMRSTLFEYPWNKFKFSGQIISFNIKFLVQKTDSLLYGVSHFVRV